MRTKGSVILVLMLEAYCTTFTYQSLRRSQTRETKPPPLVPVIRALADVRTPV